MAGLVLVEPGQVLTGTPRLALVGAPGAGKTSVGREIAARRGLPFIDTDERIEALAGMPLDDIFAVAGQEQFTAWQHDAVLAALREPDAVVAVSSGAILDADVRAALAPIPVLWLRVDATHSSRRSGLSAVAPAFFAGMRAQMVQQIAERDPLCQQVADHVVDTSALTLEQTVAAADAAWGQR